jgi:protein O-mannosyl-transferase
MQPQDEAIATCIPETSAVEQMKMNGEPAHLEDDAWQMLAKFFRHPAVLLPTLAFATAILYSGTLFFEFVWDDKAQIVNNPLIRSLGKLHKVFVSDLWYHTVRFQLYYRPLFVIWSMLNYAVVGLRPWAWHLTAVLVHVAAVLAVFWLVRKLGVEYWTAALAALIFALHPIHIECVAWISAVSDSMATAFAALSFAFFLHARNSERRHATLWHVVSCALFACALLTKEIALGFPALVAVYVWLFPSEKDQSVFHRVRAAVVSAFPYAAVTFSYLMLRNYALSQVTGKFDPNHTQADVLLTMPYVLVFYLSKLTLPVGLTGLYYFPYVTTLYLGKFVLPLLLLLALVGLLLFWSRKKNDPLVLFAGLWLAISLGPALYLRAFTEGEFVRDRYIYLGSIGFAVLAAKAIRMLPPARNWSAATVQGTATTVLCLIYIGVSLPQQAYWDSDLLIYSRGYQLYPENPYTEIGLAREYSQRGVHDRAIALAQLAVREHPEYGYGPLALAEAYIHAGRFEEGRIWLDRIDPDYAKSEIGMAEFASLYGEMGDYERALVLCSEVLEKEPNLYSALYNCGNINLLDGRYRDAEELLSRAVQSVPEQAGPKHFLGRALLKDGRNAEAQSYLLQAATMDPTVWDYHYWLAESLEQSGNLPAARIEYQRALQLNQYSKEARMRLAALEAK